MGALQCRGSLCNEKGKWQIFFIQILDGTLQQFVAVSNENKSSKKGVEKSVDLSRGNVSLDY